MVLLLHTKKNIRMISLFNFFISKERHHNERNNEISFFNVVMIISCSDYVIYVNLVFHVLYLTIMRRTVNSIDEILDDNNTKISFIRFQIISKPYHNENIEF